MIKVTKEQFFEAVNKWGAEGKDPMPSRNESVWRCQKTRKVFGKIDSKGYGNSHYFLAEV